MSEVQLRPAAADDLVTVLQINGAAVPAVNDIDGEELRWLADRARTFCVAETDDGVLAGFVIALGPRIGYRSLNYSWFSERYDDFIYVDRIVVAEVGRGIGVGQSLYRHVADTGRDHGAPVMLAEVNIKPRNDGSLRFHERFGFESVGEQDTEGGAKRVVLLAHLLG